MTTGILIVNYNMPERTDALVEAIRERVECPYELVVIDNGSDLVACSRYTNLWLPENCQTTRGWLAGLEVARKRGCNYYWFLITSAEFPLTPPMSTSGPSPNSGRGEKDPLGPMVRLLEEVPEAVGVHPALTEDSTTAWKHMIARGGGQPRQTWMIDNIASLYRADWFDRNGRFDPLMKYGWGIDLEVCWKARSQRKSLWIHEGVRVKKVTDIGYTMDRMRMSAEERRCLAAANMAEVLSERYGDDFDWRMRNEFVTEEMR